jgi:RES domain-containing protein
VEHAPLKKLPKDWRVAPPPPSAKQLGDTWVREGRSAILCLPSVIIPDEVNYVLNPGHRDFGKMFIGKPKPFAFDPRLL